MISLVMLAVSGTLLIVTSPLQTQSGQNTLIAFVLLSTLAMAASGWVLWREQILETIERLRTPLKVSPEAVDIILARAIAEPHVARAMIQSIRNAIRSHPSRKYDALVALDWFIPGTGTRSHWQLRNRTLSVEVTHPDFRIAHGRLYLRRELLPDTIVTGIDRMRLADLIEIPFLRKENSIDAAGIRFKQDAVVFDVFRDRREIDDLYEALWALHNKSLEGQVINDPKEPPLGGW
jgi:hypothetical protein